jgi:hypothetical protein
MKLLKWRSLAALILLAVPMIAHAEWAGEERKFVLFDGGALDSTEHSSKWIPVKDAMRIIIRTWSTHGAFTGPGSGDVDSTTTDSIATWKTDFSDSVLFIARDSAGTVVTARSTVPVTSAHGEPYPVCADSIEFTNNVSDSAKANILIAHAPVNEPLRAPANGSGTITHIFNLLPNTSATLCGDCTIQKGYMKIKITPLRRVTSLTNSTAAGACGAVGGGECNRTNGLSGLRMVAYVVYRRH